MQWTCGLTTWSTWAGGFFFSSSGDHRHLHSFPTRRSSDLADILHCLQLNNRGRPTRSVNAVDVRSPSSRWVIRKDLADQGIDTIQKFVAWKRPGGARPIFGISSLGGTAHLWAHYFMEKYGFEDQVTWVPVGNVDTMLGSLKTRQIDMLGTTVSLVTDAEKNGWGKFFF